MQTNPTFWAAFWAGLAAPLGLYAPPAPYMAYVYNYTIPQSFSGVGMYLTRASVQIANVSLISAT